MKKMRLDLGALRVESFHPDDGAGARGTVHGQECTCLTACTCPNMGTCDESCRGSCAYQYTCPATCLGGTCEYSCAAEPTCDPSCDTCP